MNKICTILVLLLFFTNIVAHASEKNVANDISLDTIERRCVVEGNTIDIQLPSLTYLYYNDSINNVLDRNYDFHLMNKKRRLEFWHKEFTTIGIISGMAVLGINAWLADKYDWNLWIDIPIAAVVSAATVFSISLIGLPFLEKANAIKVVPITEMNVNDDTTVGAVMYVDDMQQSKSFGVQIKTKF